MAPRKHRQVGDKIHHEDYGVGMVVEVRARPFFDILEVAFADGVKRLNSNHPKITEQSFHAPSQEGNAQSVVPAGMRRESRTGRALAAVSGSNSRAVAPQNAAPEAESVPTAQEEQEDGGLHFLDQESLVLDDTSLAEILSPRKAPKDSGRAFLFHLQAERLSLTRGFENLMALSAVRDLQRYDFQIQACLRVLRQMRGRAILADEVGLGKTIEAGLILKEYVMRGLVRRALVLTPVSLMTQWAEELRHKFDLPFTIRTRGQGWGDEPFLIASIDTAKTTKNREDIGDADFDLLVVDEAHRLRNHLTQGWRFVDTLSLKYLLLLTATPVQNDLRELFNLVTLLKPGLLGTYRAFRKEFMVRGDKRLPKNTRQLARTLSRVMVRTSRSSTSLVFPKREVTILPFEMGREERRFYDGVADFVRAVVEESEPKDYPRWHLLLLVLQKEMGSSSYTAVKTLERSQRVFGQTVLGKRLIRLTQLGRSVTTQAKVEGLRKLLQEQERDEKVIVFTQFRRTLEFLEAVLRQDGIEPAIFHGSLTAADKDRAIESFREGRQVLLSTEAGGEGRNLQFCRTVVNFDLPWNPMRVEQRIGRVHRLGQTRDTRIYNFTTRDTVEDHVLAILHQKIQMFELVVGEMDMVLGHWSDRESFESEVFRIWASYRDARQRRQAFDKLGEDLLLARKRHERVKEFDEMIFSRLDAAPAARPADEGAA